MNLTTDEHRALTFVAALLALSAAVRFLGLPEPMDVPGEDGFDLAGHIEAVEAAVEEKEAAERPLEPGERIDPNTATAAELTRLPRVGPALAGRIVADREANGRYRSLADLDRVSGVGEKTLEALAPHLALRPAATIPSSPHRGSAASPALTPRTRPARPIASSPSGRAPGGTPLDLNRATAAELETLPGIGPVLAARIVAYRDSVGRFDAVSDLSAVPGIGPATLTRIGDGVVVR